MTNKELKDMLAFAKDDAPVIIEVKAKDNEIEVPVTRTTISDLTWSMARNEVTIGVSISVTPSMVLPPSKVRRR